MEIVLSVGFLMSSSKKCGRAARSLAIVRISMARVAFSKVGPSCVLVEVDWDCVLNILKAFKLVVTLQKTLETEVCFVHVRVFRNTGHEGKFWNLWASGPCLLEASIFCMAKLQSSLEAKVSSRQWPEVSVFVASFCTLERVQFTHVHVFSDSLNVQKSVTQIIYLWPLPSVLCQDLPDAPVRVCYDSIYYHSTCLNTFYWYLEALQ